MADAPNFSNPPAPAQPLAPPAYLPPQPPPSFYPAPTPPKPVPKRTPLDVLIPLGTFIVSFLLVDLGFLNRMVLGFSIAVAAAYALGFVLAAVRKIKLRPAAIVYAVLGLALASLFTVQGSVNEMGGNMFGIWFLALTVITALFLLELTGAMRYGADSYWSILDVLWGIFIAPLAGIGGSMRFIFQKSTHSKGNVGKVLLGLLLAIPVVAIVIPLLMESDARFDNLVGEIFDSLGIWLLEAFLSALLFIPLWALLYSLAYEPAPKKPAQVAQAQRIDPVVTCVFLGVVIAVYVLYLITQSTEFFSAFRSEVPQDGLPADYARTGFYELCIAAIINAVLILPVLAFTKRKDTGTADLTVRLVAAVLCGETLLLIATALRKMVLYIERFALSERRVQTFAIMIFLALAFLILLARLFVRKLPAFQLTAVAAACVLLVLSFGFGDAWIVRTNADLFKTHQVQQPDFKEFRWSTAAVPALVDVARNDEDPRIREAANVALTWQYESSFFDSYEWRETHADGRSWSLCDAQYEAAMRSYRKEFYQWAKPYWSTESNSYDFRELFPEDYERDYDDEYYDEYDDTTEDWATTQAQSTTAAAPTDVPRPTVVPRTTGSID
ncbi:MAG: DUF4173 domain-containing protein [Oscillospiraceae bacterium]|jgi:hypothetical protein|nr:DUF4173 domain-containing protein [Oscillospiraceae bacterium]